MAAAVFIALFLLFIAILFYVQLKDLLSVGEKKEAAVYTGLMVIAAVIGTMLFAGIPVLSPTEPIRAVFEPVGKWFFPGK